MVMYQNGVDTSVVMKRVSCGGMGASKRRHSTGPYRKVLKLGLALEAVLEPQDVVGLKRRDKHTRGCGGGKGRITTAAHLSGVGGHPGPHKHVDEGLWRGGESLGQV